MVDLSERPRSRIQLTTDGLGSYPNAVGLASPHNIDFAQLVKQCTSDPSQPSPQDSPHPKHQQGSEKTRGADDQQHH